MRDEVSRRLDEDHDERMHWLAAAASTPLADRRRAAKNTSKGRKRRKSR